MILSNFKVENYKIFKHKYSLQLIKKIENADSTEEDTIDKYFTILTGKNNMGKSTFLEAINEFYAENKAANKISAECFNDKEKSIIFEAELLINHKDKEMLNCINEELKTNEEEYNLTVFKKYEIDKKSANFEIKIHGYEDIQINNLSKKIISYINQEQPYYIKPNMSTEEIDKLVKNIYLDALISANKEDERKITQINQTIKNTIYELKNSTDELIRKIEEDVSETLNELFKGQGLSLKILGGEPVNISINDLMKSVETQIKIDSLSREDMLLSEQGTGVQRMSLIYTIQKIIQNGLGNLGNRMLLVDEPEAFLHPEAIRGLSDSLYKIGDSMPIIITTHSPILINLDNPHTIIDIFKIDKESSSAITLYNSQKNKFVEEDKENMKILNYVDSYINEFFFSEKVIVVEGSTEKLVLKYIKKEFNQNFHIVEARGKSTIATLMKILNQFDTKYYVLHDLDNNFETTEKNLKTQETNCKNILKLKTEKVKLYACDYTFEKAFYGNSASNSTKTSKIFDILNCKDSSTNYSIKMDILSTFNAIFELGLVELSQNINKKVIEINNEEDIIKSFQKKDNKIVFNS